MKIRLCWIFLVCAAAGAAGALYWYWHARNDYALLLAVFSTIHLLEFLVTDGAESAEGFKVF